MICSACDFYFKSLTGSPEGRICEKRPLIKNGIEYINSNKKSCKNFQIATFIYCPGTEAFKAAATCVKNRRNGECEKDHCGLGRAIIKYRRRHRK